MTKKKKQHKSNFCKRLDCYYNDGKCKCTTGNRIENKNMYCIFYTKESNEEG